MGKAIDWRSPYFSTIFERYDRADFAQEFLRRSPVYRRDYVTALSASREAGKSLFDRLAARWGLVFRRRSRR